MFASIPIGSRESLVQVIDGWRNVNDSKTKEGSKKAWNKFLNSQPKSKDTEDEDQMEGDFLQRLRRKYATYGDLLELTIPGNVFSIRKVDEVRKEIEESLRKLASSVISQYWKTKGRKRYELD